MYLSKYELNKLLHYLFPFDIYIKKITNIITSSEEYQSSSFPIQCSHSIKHSHIELKKKYIHIYYKHIETIYLYTDEYMEKSRFFYFKNQYILKSFYEYVCLVYTLKLKLENEFQYNSFLHYSNCVSYHSKRIKSIIGLYNIKYISSNIILKDTKDMGILEQLCQCYDNIFLKLDQYVYSEYHKHRIYILNGIFSMALHITKSNIQVFSIGNQFCICIHIIFNHNIGITIGDNPIIEYYQPNYINCVIYTKEPLSKLPVYKYINRNHLLHRHLVLKKPTVAFYHTNLI